MDGNRNIIKRLARIAIFSALLFIQEEIMSFIPNIQFTQLLITVYFFAFGFIDTSIIILIYIFLDNLVMGTFNIIYTPTMIIAWFLLIVLLLPFRKCKNRFIPAIIVFIHAYLYSWCYLISSVFMYQVPFKQYLIADLPFEIIFSIVGFTTVVLFKNRLVSILNKLMKKEPKKEEEIVE